MLALCALAGLARALSLLAHEPLVALANSYDEVRYTACFDLYPDRPADVRATQNSPESPYSHYRFVPGASPICYWSSELLLQGTVAAGFALEQRVGGGAAHSVRWLGALKLALLLALWCAFCRAFLRQGDRVSALANGLLLPFLFADPANTIYLNTFYAEWSALLAMYALCGLILLHHERAPTRFARPALALAAFLLAASKIQHLLLPLACAGVVLGLGYLSRRRWPWQGSAVLAGALCGLALQVVQLGRDSDAIRAIEMFNRADVAFTGLFPNASDAAATAAQIGVDADCLRFSGKRAWEMQDYPGHACPSLKNLSRARELGALLRDPALSLRLGWHGVLALDPWLAPGLGLVEGADFAPLPADLPTFSSVLARWPLLRLLLLGGPFLALPLLGLGRLARGHTRWLLYSVLTAVIMLASLTVTILGDGLADAPKQGHLVINAALAWWIAVLALAAARALGFERAPASPVERAGEASA